MSLDNVESVDAIGVEKDSGTINKIFSKYGKGLATSEPARRAAMTQLYLAALNRPPNDRELNRVLSKEVMRFYKMPSRYDQAFYQGFFQDMFWALLNSNEFILNH